MYRFAACAVRKRTPPLSGIAECGRGRKRRYLATFLNVRKMCANACCRTEKYISGCSEVGIALDLGSRDRAFESPHSDQKSL